MAYGKNSKKSVRVTPEEAAKAWQERKAAGPAVRSGESGEGFGHVTGTLSDGRTLTIQHSAFRGDDGEVVNNITVYGLGGVNSKGKPGRSFSPESFARLVDPKFAEIVEQFMAETAESLGWEETV